MIAVFQNRDYAEIILAVMYHDKKNVMVWK